MRFLLLLWFGFLIGDFAGAQSSEAISPLVLSNISEQNGLSDDHVQCVLKDREGLVWIGTMDGLNLMDGSSIKVFKHVADDSNSLINDNVLCLREDGSGNIWIGTAGGISYFRKDRNLFSSFVPPASPYGSSFAVNAIVLDEQKRIWWSTDGGLFLLDTLSKKFQPYYIHSNEQQTNVALANKLHHIMEDSEHRLWVASSDGLWTFDLRSLQFKKQISKENDQLYHGLFLYTYEDHLHKIWAGNWQYGLKQVEQNTGRVINYDKIPGHPGSVSCINEVRMPDGRFMVWLSGKMIAFDPVANVFIHYTRPMQFADYPEVSPVFRSSDNWLWMSSPDKGLYIYNPQQQLFQHKYFDQEITSQGIVFGEWKNWLLAGAQGGSFLTAYDSNFRVNKTFAPLVGIPSARPYAAALSFASESENNLWVGTSEGIVKMDMVTGKNRWFVHSQQDSNSLPRNFITHLFLDSKKQLWVFPWREGIWTMDEQTGKCRRLLEGFIPGPEHLKRLVVADAVEDSDNNIWMADLDEGILLYDRKKNAFSKPFTSELGERSHTSRIFYRNNFCYSNTSFSLLKWDPVSRHLQQFRPPAEISKEIYDITPDQQGNWWIATRNGLIEFDEKTNSFRRYTIADGLLNNDMNGTLFCRHDGMIVFGASNYFTVFDPRKLLSGSQDAKPVLLRTVLVNEKPVNIAEGKALQLDYRSSNIELRWALPDYTSPFKNQYYCLLQGIDSGWRYLGNKGEIQYASLAAGSYTVLLKAATSNGTGAENILRLDFVIHPPFWKTTAFLVLLAAVLVTGAVILARYIVRRNLQEKLLRLEKEQAIEKERNRISRDMHDDLGSGLTKIAILSEVIKKQMGEPEKAKEQLDIISASSRELVDNLQDIIWVLNPQNDTLENLAAHIREYSSKFFEPFEIALRFNYPDKFPAIKLSEESRRNIFLVIKESLNNIARHAASRSVEITLRPEASRLFISIKDDGKGFDKDRLRTGGNGLVNMDIRMKQVGGNYRIDAKPGGGTETILDLPI